MTEKAKLVMIKKLLGVNLNNRLGVETHVRNICDRVSKKLHALARIMSIHEHS